MIPDVDAFFVDVLSKVLNRSGCDCLNSRVRNVLVEYMCKRVVGCSQSLVLLDDMFASKVSP